MKQKKPSLLTTKSGLKSASLKAIALGLSTHFQRKVWRTTKPSLKRKQFKYGQSVDKLTQYKWFQDNEIPALEFTNHDLTAASWVEEGSIIFGRKYLNASCGKGIVVIEKLEDFVPCQQYHT